MNLAIYMHPVNFIQGASDRLFSTRPGMLCICLVQLSDHVHAAIPTFDKFIPGHNVSS